MRHVLYGFTPSSSTRLSVNGGYTIGVSPLTAAKLQTPGGPAIAAARTAVGPLTTVGNGTWFYPGRAA